MELNDDANLDPSQVEDMRGSRGGGGRFRLPGGRGGSGGGGLGGGGLGGSGVKLPAGKAGIAIVLVVLLCLCGFGCLGQGGLGSLGSLGSLGGLTGTEADTASSAPLDETCSRQNTNRFDDPACVNLAFVNSIQAYWQRGLPENFGRPYQTATTRYFSGAVSTGCGSADAGVGPFYCPADNHVYIDLSFYDELATRFGAPGQFAQAYVMAHEYGHHVQTLLGTEAQMRRQQQRDPGNTNALSVMLELQADCYAGVWARAATTTTDAGGQPLFTNVTQQDIQQALTAAAAVGDDTIQRKAGGRVNEQAFTHGSAQQRQQWFDQGYRTGDPKRCDTFGNAL
ncbi:KPN_02809 family neutral zinc metallopeptidase [Phytohabitans houttuyneae]|uniref:Membrane protein n=1 Tax=Phytohabitans houttuyneae TaxID=1076126 RepID=A0A6V8KLQ2_9ACTN|nr:neutral zinc metallopeptidase [Phytohabitans houttuyneae]GFJ86132.1 membrane protein [Phytohabitans houttuyneae]